MSVMSCESNRLEGKPDVVVCAVDTLLVADFYWRPHGNVAVVKAYGSAVLQFGTSNQGAHQNIGKRLRRVEMASVDQNSQHELDRALQGVPLDTFWNMTRPKVDFPGIEGSSGGFDFRMNYTLSDAISNEMVRMEIWEKNCQETGKEPKLAYDFDEEASSNLLEVTSTDAYATGEGWGSQMITVNGRWKRGGDFSGLLMESPYYQENSDRSLVQISLCARYQLHTKPEIGSTEVNFLETPIIINIDMNARLDFSVNIELVSNEDPCLDALDNQLKTLSGGRGGVDDLFMSDLYWQPGSYSTDPTMSMGPPTLASYTKHGGRSNAVSSTNQPRNQQGISSADASKYSWRKIATIGILTFFVLV